MTATKEILLYPGDILKIKENNMWNTYKYNPKKWDDDVFYPKPNEEVKLKRGNFFNKYINKLLYA